MAKRPWRRLNREVRVKIIRLAAKGHSREEIARAVNRGRGSVANVVVPLGGVFRSDRGEVGTGRRLSMDDRVGVLIGLERSHSFARIGRELGRSTSTISREVHANGGRSGYRPVVAQERADELARRPKPGRLAQNSRLCARVVEDLEALLSPEQIAGRLRHDFPGESEMWVSHETIYKSLYVQGRGELRRELAQCLRTGRTRRKQRGRLERRDHIPDMVMISDRPAEVEDRAVPGHWEGDLIMGANNLSAIGTLVERTSRFVMLLHLADAKTAPAVRDAMTRAIRSLPESLARSVTWDQGREMVEHVQFRLDTGVDVYFCDPHSPWQRGTNENTNGLLRQYFPKGTDLSVHDAATLQAAADSLNNRPRKTLGWKTPSETLAALIAATD